MEEHEVLHIISRKKAKELNMTYYFSGLPCKRGHIVKRYVSNGNCNECGKALNNRQYYKHKDKRSARSKEYYQETRDYKLAYQKNYAEENKDEVAKSKRNWYVRHKDRIRKDRKEYYKEHKDDWKEWQKVYYPENKDKICAQKRERYKNDPLYRMAISLRSQQRKITKLCFSEMPERQEGEIAELYEHLMKNLLPGMSADNYGEWHVDHKYPVARFLSDGITDINIINSLDNLIPMWGVDNMSKNNKTLEEWLDEKGEDSREYTLYSKFLNKE